MQSHLVPYLAFTVSAFVALFITLSLAFCDIIWTSIPLPFHVTESISPTAHLSVFTSVSVASLAALPLLHWQHICLQSISRLFSQPQTWIMKLKCMFDCTLASLMARDFLKGIDNSKQIRVQILCKPCATFLNCDFSSKQPELQLFEPPELPLFKQSDS